MSVGLVLSILAVAVLLIGCEWWSRRYGSETELSRKFIHLTVGSFVAFWPFFLSWNQIRFLSLAFIAVLLISKQFHIFRSIHSVERPTWGEVLFAISVGLLTFIVHDPSMYAASLLLMSLADGLAAVVGVHAPPKLQYKVFGHTKSIPGTLTFLAVTIVVLVGYQLSGAPLPIAQLALIGGGATILENLGIFGLDNLLVPVFAAVVLRFL